MKFADREEETSRLQTALSGDETSLIVVYGTVYGRARRWWGSVVNEDEEPEQIEIDVVAESLNKKSLLVGECKWTAHEDAWTLTGDLLRKARLLPFASRYKIVPVLFLKNAPENDAGNTLLPHNVIELCK